MKMEITRLSKEGLEAIILGKTKRTFNCVVKFYSNECHLCLGLRDIYENTAKAFDGKVHFLVFNSSDHPSLERLIDVNGTPTIVFVKARKNPLVKVMEDPKEPDRKSWYHADDIAKFIEDNLDD